MVLVIQKLTKNLRVHWYFHTHKKLLKAKKPAVISTQQVF